MTLLLLLSSWALAFPVRGPALVPPDSGGGVLEDVAVLKLKEGLRARVEEGRLVVDSVVDPRHLGELLAALEGAEVRARFSRPPDDLRRERWAVDPGETLADLSLYFRIEGPGAATRVEALRESPLVELAHLAMSPAPPPDDIDPETPDFTSLQGYLQPAPEGLGLDEAGAWPGGTGAGVVIADIEYGWDPTHEDLGLAPTAMASGWTSGLYLYHGNSVLGQLVGEDNGYGVTGMVPLVQTLVVSPYRDRRTYDVADAINRAVALLQPGDVLLVEQQGWVDEVFCPVEVDQGVFDAITLAVAAGIVVVEPGGNGASDLDDPSWAGIFDREVRDSGAILVGGGASPDSGYEPRSWYPWGSSFGERVDVQGWYDGIVTATSAEYEGSLADLFLPDGDGRQAYTRSFGGTSGASPMVAAVAAVAQSVALQTDGVPLEPMVLRTLLVSTGLPQPPDDPRHIGPFPSLRRLLRMGLVP